MLLEFHVSTGIPTPVFRQIVDQVRRAIAMGSWQAGDQLPSVRALAEQVVVNPNTVAKAYGELVRDGLIEARQGRGYFVADRRQVYSDAERKRRLDQILWSLVSEALVLNFTDDEIIDALRRALSGFRSASGHEEGDSHE